MTGWDVLNNVVGGFPFVVTAFFLIATFVALIIFIVGFSKYGFRQKEVGDLAQKIDDLRIGFKSDLAQK
jgi:hypothetical protein